jgi:hypothetical protein
MGAGASKGSLTNPFPISSIQDKNLDKLSYAAARILSTPDIYDINNLARPGVCGDYAVFLKETITQTLLPFTMEEDGKMEEVLYQNPLKTMDLEKRKKICGQLADTTLRAIMVVIACLASMQVKSHDNAIALVPKQQGGSVAEVRQWLFTNGFLKETKEAYEPAKFANPGAPDSRFYTFKLTLENAQGTVTPGLISVDTSRTPTESPIVPRGSLRVQFLSPILVTAPGVNEIRVLPMRIMDEQRGLAWAAGVLVSSPLIGGSAFKTFGSQESFYITDLFSYLFLKAQGITVDMPEDRNSINSANSVFIELKRGTQTQQVLHQALGTWFQGKLGSSYQIGTPYAYPQYPYPQPQPQPQYPYQYPQYVQPIGQPIAQPLAQPIAPKPLGTPLGQGIIPGLIQKDGVFDIPDSARRFMSLRFRQFRELIPKESSPAASRAHTLTALINRDNSVQTGVCRDPYWTEANPNKIYPWATLQLLCVDDWTTLSDDYGRVTFKKQWKEKFLGPLAEIYNGTDLPKLESGKVLEQMRFTNVSAIPVCKNRQDPRVGFREIQNTLVKLQGLYDGHIVHMWRLINSLIFTIVDPVKKTEMVRLHKNSQKHVEAIADEARDRIADFYIQVERIYSETVKKLTEL